MLSNDLLTLLGSVQVELAHFEWNKFWVRGVNNPVKILYSDFKGI